MSYINAKIEQCKNDNKTVTLYLDTGHVLAIRIVEISEGEYIVGRNQEFDHVVVPFTSIKAIGY